MNPIALARAKMDKEPGTPDADMDIGDMVSKMSTQWFIEQRLGQDPDDDSSDPTVKVGEGW